MSTKMRFMEHLKEKGVIPKSYECGGRVKGYAMGGEVYSDDDDDAYEFGWNDHGDTSGEPERYGTSYPRKGVSSFSVVDDMDQSEPMAEMKEDEIKKYMVRALEMRRKR